MNRPYDRPYRPALMPPTPVMRRMPVEPAVPPGWPLLPAVPGAPAYPVVSGQPPGMGAGAGVGDGVGDGTGEGVGDGDGDGDGIDCADVGAPVAMMKAPVHASVAVKMTQGPSREIRIVCSLR